MFKKAKVTDQTAAGQGKDASEEDKAKKKPGIKKRSKVPGVMITQYIEDLPDGKSTPDFLRKPIALTIQEGKLALFKAVVSGDPKPELTWDRAKGDLTDKERFQQKFNETNGEYTLLIPKVSGEDADTYKCYAQNEYGKAVVTAILHVIEVGYKKSKALQTEEADMNPQEFRKMLRKRAGKEKEEHLKREGGVDDKFWDLLMSSDKKDYEGLCKEFGVTDFRWMLKKLNEIKKEREEEQKMYVETISNLKHIEVKGEGLACFSIDLELADPNSRIFLYKDGVMVPYSEEVDQKHSLKRIGKSLVFSVRDLKAEDAGLYQIDVEEVNMFSTDFKIPTVDFVAKIQEVKAQEREDAVFECVLSHPLPKIQWLGRNSTLENGEKYTITVSEDRLIHKLLIKDCLQLDKGIYTAVAGIKTCSAWLIVEADTGPKGKKAARKTTQAGGGADLEKLAREQQEKLAKEREEEAIRRQQEDAERRAREEMEARRIKDQEELDRLAREERERLEAERRRALEARGILGGAGDGAADGSGSGKGAGGKGTGGDGSADGSGKGKGKGGGSGDGSGSGPGFGWVSGSAGSGSGAGDGTGKGLGKGSGDGSAADGSGKDGKRGGRDSDASRLKGRGAGGSGRGDGTDGDGGDGDGSGKDGKLGQGNGPNAGAGTGADGDSLKGLKGDGTDPDADDDESEKDKAARRAKRQQKQGDLVPDKVVGGSGRRAGAKGRAGRHAQGRAGRVDGSQEMEDEDSEADLNAAGGAGGGAGGVGGGSGGSVGGVGGGRPHKGGDRSLDDPYASGDEDDPDAQGGTANNASGSRAIRRARQGSLLPDRVIGGSRGHSGSRRHAGSLGRAGRVDGTQAMEEEGDSEADDFWPTSGGADGSYTGGGADSRYIGGGADGSYTGGGADGSYIGGGGGRGSRKHGIELQDDPDDPDDPNPSTTRRNSAQGGTANNAPGVPGRRRRARQGSLLPDTVIDPGVQFVVGLSNVTTLLGQPAELLCKVSSEQCEGTWFKDGKKITDEAGITVSKDGASHKLVIDKCQEEHSGKYRFEAEGRKSEAIIAVQDPPRFDKEELEKFSSPITVKAGQNAVFKLPFEGHEPSKIQWYRKGEELMDEPGVKIENLSSQSRLLLSKCTRKQTGEIKIRIKNEYGTVEAVTQLIVLDKPTAPQGPVETVESSGQCVEIKWRAPKDDGGMPIKNYILERQQIGRNTWTKIGEIPGNPTYKDTNVEHGRKYCYRIQAITEQGVSEVMETEDIQAGTLAFPSQPAAPKVVSASNDCINLTWTTPSDTGGPGSRIVGYNLEKRKKGSNLWSQVNPAGEQIQGKKYAVKDVVAGVEYEFRVIAFNLSGPSEPSHASPFVIARDPKKAPGKVLDLKLTETTYNTVSLSWSKPEERKGIQDEPKGYFVEVRPAESLEWLRSNTTPIILTSYMVKGLKSMAMYWVRVIATNDGGDGEPADLENYIMAMPPPVRPKFTTRNMQHFMVVRAGNTLRINLAFEASPWPDVEWDKDGMHLGKRATISNSDTGSQLLIPSSERTDTGIYTIVVKNMVGQETFSIEVRVTDEPKPPGPIELEENVPGTVTVTWEPSIDEKRDDRLHYCVSQRDSTKRTWHMVADRLFNRKFTACNIMQGREYHFRVYAKNDMGMSPFSESPTWGTTRQKEKFVVAMPEYRKCDFQCAPTFTAPLKVRVAPKGYECYMTCAIRANPRPRITWYHNNVSLNTNTNYLITNTCGVCSILILRVAPRDFGEYMVTAENALGRAETATNLTVRD